MKKNVSICLAALVIMFAASVPSIAVQGSCPPKLVKGPDLVVTSIKVDKSDDKNVKVIYTVKNQGKTASDPSNTTIRMVSKKNKKDITALTNVTPSLDPGKSYTTEINYPIRAKGDFVFNATADYNKRIIESNESNNTNTVGFSIGLKIGK
ncbi:MAG: CARDB domain-containing protein [Candidatus Margulisiibacteriota bacterium]|jgi:subtilase family serine protease